MNARVAWSVTALSLMLACAGSARITNRIDASESNEAMNESMSRAARALLETLPKERRAKATRGDFASPTRRDWHYIPRKHDGLELSEMSDSERVLAKALVRSALSSQGMGKVEQIQQLDEVLREAEEGKGPRRDPLGYAVTIFGTPGVEPWGWKFEGHHISLNFTIVDGEAAVTPAFFGANPAEVRQGVQAGKRVLGTEDDLARELLASLRPEQRGHAVLGDKAPADILGVPGRALSEIDGSGLAVGEMAAPQRELVEQLVGEYARNLRSALAKHELDRISHAGWDKIRFAWLGSDQRGKGSYYRLSGPSFVIECDNTQDGANHIHTLWRDRERDFGEDLLAEHYKRAHQTPSGDPAATPQTK